MDPQASNGTLESEAPLAEWQPPTLAKLPANLAEAPPKSASGGDGLSYS
jgi:hypothetical protein